MNTIFDFSNFTKPVKFYGYTSCVTNPIIEVRMDCEFDELNSSEQDIVEFIEVLRSKLHQLDRRSQYSSTKRDNKTVIAMSDDNDHILYFGKYDRTYMIGFGCWSESKKSRIELSDLEELPKLNDPNCWKMFCK